MSRIRHLVVPALLAALPLSCASAQQGGTLPDVAPSERHTVYLPTGHPSYPVLERLRGAGLLTGSYLNLDQRPLSRLTMARALLGGTEAARERGLHGLARSGEWQLREFGREAAAIHRVRAEEGTEGGAAGWRVQPMRRAPLSITWEDPEGPAWLEGEMTMELGYSGREDLPPDFEPAAVGRGGVEVYGQAGENLGYAARYRQSSETRSGTIKGWKYDPVQGAAQLRSFGDYRAYTESSGHLSWDGRYLGADLRFGSPDWGPSPERDLLLSGSAPSFGHVQGRVAFGEWLRYAVVVGSLKSGIIDSTRSYQPDDPTRFRAIERQKYLIGHRLDLYPLPSLKVGLTEMAVAADRFPELLYLVPTVSVWDAQHYLNDPDNTMIGLDLTWSPAGGPTLYGAIALDEWQMGDTFADSTHHNWMAFQLGASWTPPLQEGRWHLWVEGTRVLPNVYRHKYPVNDWEHAGHYLGFWTGQNADVLQGEVRYLVSARVEAGLRGRYARKGGLVSRIEQYIIPPSEDFLFGEVRLGGWTGAFLEFHGVRHWTARLDLRRAPARLWPHSGAGSAGQEFQFFLRLTYNPF
ncbi:MAG: hypothetical protein R6W82_00225 [bacterium]